MIYFAQPKRGGKIKIGRSNDVAKRVSDLSSASPEPLVLLATLNASDQVETLLHRALNGPDSHREWHSPTVALMGLIKSCEAGIDLGPLLDSFVGIPAVKRATKPRAKRRKSKRKLPLPQPPKAQMNLSDAERKRRSEAMKQRYKEGKIGGSKYGKLGGRPRKRKPALD